MKCYFLPSKPMILYSKLSYENHLQSVFSKRNEAIGLLKKFRLTLPKTFPVTIYKSFIKPHLDYDYVVYDGPSNESFH